METLLRNATTKASIPDSVVFTWIGNHVTTSILTIFAIWLTYFIYSVRRYRISVIERSGDLKRLPGNLWFGTVPAMVDIFKVSPQETHPQATMTLLQRKHNLDGVFFMDAWPAIDVPQLCIIDPAVAAQVTQTKSLPKSPEVKKFVAHATGPTSLIYTEGNVWKKARSVFNPGFALSHLMTLVPSIVDDTTVFCNILEELATTGEVTQIEELAAKLAFDIMGHIVLDHDLNSQLGPNELVDSFRHVLNWTPSASNVNPFKNMNPFAKVVHKYYNRKMNRYISDILDERYASKSREPTTSSKKWRKPAIDLALDEYAKQEVEAGRVATRGIDTDFKNMAIDQMKSFLFAGHDTSSTTVCFCYHNLSRHPDADRKIREEIDAVFGVEGDVAELLKEDPNLINKLPYTTAVIKETLRLFPPASTVRTGTKDVNINYNGRIIPTDGCMVWVVSHTIHRRPDLFPNPDAFLPERFLPPDHPDRFQEVVKDSWRPFEKGPRNCIGQELAMLELKIILAMTCRKYWVENAYKQWDEKLGREKPGEQLDGQRGMFGDRAYQVLQASAKPKDGFPGTVRRRSPA